MLFWIIALALSGTVALALVVPLRRSGEAAPEDPDLAFYRDQLAEIDSDRERGLIDAAEAERARAEVGRRLLSADRAAHPSKPMAASHGATRLIGVFTVVAIIGGALAIYLQIGAPDQGDLPLSERLASARELRENRPDQAQAEAQAGPGPAIEVPEDYAEMVAQLRDAVPDRPDDLTGWQLLSRHEATLGNYAAAARAQDRVIELKGEDATPEDRLALADRMVAAAGGIVSPEAEAVLSQVLEARPDSAGALYYMGLMFAQTDRPDLAFRSWRQVVERGDPAQPHVRLARGQIERAAMMAGASYALPPLAASGPSAEQMEAARDMDPAARDGMIRGMVEGLAARLGETGGTAAEWARLINALGVLGETERAAAIWTEAQQVFPTGDDLETIRNAAQDAGVTE